MEPVFTQSLDVSTGMPLIASSSPAIEGLSLPGILKVHKKPRDNTEIGRLVCHSIMNEQCSLGTD